MPRWSPKPVWEGEDVYVIGGGPSLRDFDWGVLRGRNTIGCNGAYALGSEICNVVIFGDFVWWQEIGRDATKDFDGLVVGSTPRLINDNSSWLLTMPRHGVVGVGKDALGWAGNTGSLAINLALILGAQRVLLLGFDMELAPLSDSEIRTRLNREGRANWHEERYEAAQASSYPRFCNEFNKFAPSIDRVFPGKEVWNLTDGGSKLTAFPRTGMTEHFAKGTHEQPTSSR